MVPQRPPRSPDMSALEKLVRLASVLLLLSVCSAATYPTKPLNERSTELAWQAWLLVDDQNQNQYRQNVPEGGPRRRITPKSVFIAPTFSPDSLPACAEGYRSDSMGRCIKIIKLDEDAHLDFLLQKLNEKFGDSDYEDEADVEEMPTPGPFQFNIPLDGNGNNEEVEDEPAEAAIVVAPSNPNSYMKGNDSVKVDVKRNNQTQTGGNTVNVETIAHILGVKQEDVETTTIFESSTTNTDTTPSTTTTFGNTASTQFTDGTTTYTQTTVQDGDNLFYLTPTTTEEGTTFHTDSTDPTTSNTEGQDVMLNDDSYTTFTASTDYTSEDTTLLEQSTQTMTTTENQMGPETKSVVKFPDDSETEGSSSDYIKFPDPVGVPQASQQYHNTRDTSRHSANFFSANGDDGDDPSEILRHGDADSERHVFQRQFPGQQTHFVGDLPHRMPHQAFNHRNRDRHNDLFVLPPSITDSNYSSQQKPLVLRFTRKHGYLDMSGLKNPQLYREVAAEDLSNFFGFKSRQFGNR